MDLLKLEFQPNDNQTTFRVTARDSLGRFIPNLNAPLPFLQNLGDGKCQDRSLTIVKVLESIEFNKNKLIENDQEENWLVEERILREDKDNFKNDYLATIGDRLYEVLGNGIQNRINTAIDNTQGQTWLHIRLEFLEEACQYSLTDYPWELLHNKKGFLIDQGVIFSRCFALDSHPPQLSTVEQLDVLLISSSASDKNEDVKLESLPPDEVEAIVKELQNAQEEQGKIKLELLNPPTFDNLRNRLQNNQKPLPQIIHFHGHGFFGKRCNKCRKANLTSKDKCKSCSEPLGKAQGYLVFEKDDKSADADYVSAEELGSLLGNCSRQEQPISKKGIPLVVLSACKSGMSLAGISSKSFFNGVAENLIRQDIPSVVAMQYSITKSAAEAFCQNFYRSLGKGESLTIALSRGQTTMKDKYKKEWYRPVLYLRWQDNEGGKLFNIDTKPKPSEALKTNFEEIARSLKEGRLIVFLGSGINYPDENNQPPSDIEIANYLVEKLQATPFSQGKLVDSQSVNLIDLIGLPCKACPTKLELSSQENSKINCPVVNKIQDQKLQLQDETQTKLQYEQDLLFAKFELGCLSEYKIQKDGNSNTLFTILGKKLREDYQYNEVQAFLANLATKIYKKKKTNQHLSQLIIITTNYDNGLEKAFEKEGLAIDVVYYSPGTEKRMPTFLKKHYPIQGTSRDNLSYSCDNSWDNNKGKLSIEEEPLPIKEGFGYLVKSPIIVKLYGGVLYKTQKKNDSFLISESHHIEFLKNAQNGLPKILNSSLKTRDIVFIGYNANDHALKAILQCFLNNNWEEEPNSEYDEGRTKRWLVTQSPLALAGTINQQDYWDQWGIKIIEGCTLDNFIDGLQNSFNDEDFR